MQVQPSFPYDKQDMRLSTDRILTTHVGSLPRPPELLDLLLAKDAGSSVDQSALRICIRDSVERIVQYQVDLGIDVVSDGEMSKIGYSTYLKDRLNGFEGEGGRRVPRDLQEFPEYSQHLIETGGVPVGLKRPLCKGPVTIRDEEPLRTDITNLCAAVEQHTPTETFMNAASPGVVAVFMRNDYYPSHEAYLEALGKVMQVEYEAIIEAGFILQIDAPDMAMGRHMLWPDISNVEFRKIAALQIEVLNQATANIAPELMRMHI